MKEEQKYATFRASGAMDKECVLCEKEPVQFFEYWKIVTNDFPFDRVAARHDMLMPRRHTVEADLTPEEWREFQQLKGTVLSDEYDYLIEATHKTKSIPHHFHLHLIVAKEQ
jgi:hypothetical protein